MNSTSVKMKSERGFVFSRCALKEFDDISTDQAKSNSPPELSAEASTRQPCF